MSAEWVVFVVYVVLAVVGISAAIAYAVVVTRRGRAEHHLEAAERVL